MSGPGDPATEWPQGYQAPAPPQTALPGSVVASGVILIVMAVLVAIIGAILVLSASVMSSFTDPSVFGPGFEDTFSPGEFEAGMNLVGGIVIAFAIIALLIAGAHFVGGIGVLRRRSWGRITGLVLSFLAILILLISLGSTIATFGQVMPLPADSPFTAEEWRQMSASGAAVGLVINTVFLAAYAVVAFVLLRRGDVFGD